MQLHWIGFSFREHDGYGRYSNRTITTLQQGGCDVLPLFPEHNNMPTWMKRQVGIQPDVLTISCMPPYFLQHAPSGGRHWLLSMTEGSELPIGWSEAINTSDVERVIVPCEHNAKAFREGGVKVPIHVIPGGTDPNEFPLLNAPRPDRPYTFLALGDRGSRKGWTEVYKAFFQEFGTPMDMPDVRLIIKCRPGGNELLEMLAKVTHGLDPRISIMVADVDMRELYASVDCFAIPSRSEGWGMPHREAAMSGLPVITQVHSGLDDGHTAEWSIPLTKGHVEPIPTMGHIKGEWMGADVDELAAAMRWCYDNPKDAALKGQKASEWLSANQTWEHSTKALLDLIQEYG